MKDAENSPGVLPIFAVRNPKKECRRKELRSALSSLPSSSPNARLKELAPITLHRRPLKKSRRKQVQIGRERPCIKGSLPPRVAVPSAAQDMEAVPGWLVPIQPTTYRPCASRLEILFGSVAHRIQRLWRVRCLLRAILRTFMTKLSRVRGAALSGRLDCVPSRAPISRFPRPFGWLGPGHPGRHSVLSGSHQFARQPLRPFLGQLAVPLRG